MSVSEHFIVIMPRHQRILGALELQRAVDCYGGIGWKGLLDEDEVLDFDVLFKPLVERGLVEDLGATELGPGGRYFVRITALGRICNAIGMMLREPRITTEAELRKYGVLPSPPALPQPPAAPEVMV
jgi:hypothetical protein